MPNSIHNDFNPYIETFGLLGEIEDLDLQKQYIIQECNAFGIQGDMFYDRYCKIYIDYTRAFNKHKKNISNSLFKSNFKSQVPIIVGILLINNNKHYSTFEGLTDETLRDQALKLFKDKLGVDITNINYNSLDDLFSLLDISTLDEHDKWELMKLMRRPIDYLQEINAIISDNIPAYEKAIGAVKDRLKPYITRYQQCVKDKKVGNFTLEGVLGDFEIRPSLAMPFAISFLGSESIFGLLTPYLAKNTGNDLYADNQELIKALKAIGDKSRLEILMRIKYKPQYNLQIAKDMGLTPATMSHHISVLVTNQMVKIDKQEGKIYYSIDNEAVMKLIGKLQEILL